MPVHPLTNALVRGKRLALGLALATTVSVGAWSAPFTTTAYAESVRCRVLRHYLEAKSPDGPDGWMWRAASIEYMNYC